MTEIKSVNAPAIGQRGVERLYAALRETRMTPEGGAFQAGYEQAKRDLLVVLGREVAIPHPTQEETPVPVHHITPPAELRMRSVSSTVAGWWNR